MTTEAELCYKCSQTRRLISAKLANFNPSQPNADYLSEYSVFEDYLNSSNPLCTGCYNQTTSTPKHKQVLKIKGAESQSPATFLTVLILLIAVALLSTGLLVYSGHIVIDWSQINNMFDQAIILYNGAIEQIAELISEQEALDTLQLLYLTVFVIQITVVVFHKTTCTSLLTFLVAVGLQYITQYRPELIPFYLTSTMVLTSKLTLLLWSTVSAATSKRIVVKSYKISPVNCPVKVRHSPNRTPEKKPTRYRAPLQPPDQILHSLNMSAEDDVSNKESLSANTVAPTPIKDVFSKLNIFGGSPAKQPAALSRDTAYSKSLSSLSPHGPPKLPARGQLHPPKFTLNHEPSEPAAAVKKPRFDSYCDGEADEAEQVEEEVLEHVELAAGQVTMKPVIALLVVSVMVNFYLCLQYVLQ